LFARVGANEPLTIGRPRESTIEQKFGRGTFAVPNAMLLEQTELRPCDSGGVRRASHRRTAIDRTRHPQRSPAVARFARAAFPPGASTTASRPPRRSIGQAPKHRYRYRRQFHRTSTRYGYERHELRTLNGVAFEHYTRAVEPYVAVCHSAIARVGIHFWSRLIGTSILG
jgi:hypothetical protein